MTKCPKCGLKLNTFKECNRCKSNSYKKEEKQSKLLFYKNGDKKK